MSAPDVMKGIVITLVDNQGDEYLAYNVSGIFFPKARPFNATEALKDFCSFQSETLSVSKRSTGMFSADLTEDRDDLLLAILSLLLLFIIEGILTAILLRTHHGNISNFGFSIRQFMELIRDFRLRFAFRGYGNRNSSGGNNSSSNPLKQRRINFKLLFLAAAILLFTSVLEGVVLYLSTPSLTEVSNAQAAFTLIEVTNPDWNQIRDQVGAANVKPCTSIILEGVEQRNTRLNPCLTASGDTAELEAFGEAEETVLTFTSLMHEFGAEHVIKIGNWEAKYIARAYFMLEDRRRKLLRKRSLFFTREGSVAFLHRQYLAYLFNHYVRETNDTQMNRQRLEELERENKITFRTMAEPTTVPIIQLSKRQRFRHVVAQRHETTVRGVLPSGPEALRLGTAVLKASSGIAVRAGDQNDFDMGSGSTWERESLMWREDSRALNWLSLSIIVAGALLLYWTLRYLLKPIGTAEIAGMFVAKEVGADSERGPAFLGADERSSFSCSSFSTSLSVGGGSVGGAGSVWSDDVNVRRSTSYYSSGGEDSIRTSEL